MTKAHQLDLVSIQDAAVHFGVTPKTIRRWIADGLLTAYRTGPRLLRVDLSSLELRRVPTRSAS